MSFRLATPADDPALRRLLRENPMPGSIALTYEREPDYFIAAAMEGTLSQTIVQVEDASGEILGMGTRILRPLFLNGEAVEVGYMSHLRANLNQSWGLSLARQLSRAFGRFHELHADGRVPFYLMSVIADNLPAQRLLTAELPGLPHAHAYTRMYTYAISPRRLQAEIPLPNGIRLQSGTSAHVDEIVASLQRNAQRQQFSPHWTSANLFSPIQAPNLHPEDFLLAIKDSRMLGCLALWDQSPFKQIVVRGYHGGMRRARPLINLLTRFMDVPRLPPVGTPLSYCFVSHLAVDHDDPQVFASLLRAAYNATYRRGFNYFLLGMAETNPLRSLLTKRYLHITYPSQIYLMSWEEGLEAIAQVDSRIPGLEVAIL
jgi:hypothetical protein